MQVSLLVGLLSCGCLSPLLLTCRIVYLPGLEEEDLDMDDIIRDGHMMLQQMAPPPRPF